MKRANIKILALILALIVLPPLMWELKSQVGVVPGGSGGVPDNAVQGASNLTATGAIPYVPSSGTLSQDGSFLRSANGRYTIYDATATTGVTTLTVRAGAGQSSTDMVQWQNNAGTTQAKITSAGYYYLLEAQTNGIRLAVGGPQLGSAGQYAWGSSSAGSAVDLGLARSSANNLGITNGSSTTYWTLGAGGITCGSGDGNSAACDVGTTGARVRNVNAVGVIQTNSAIIAGTYLRLATGNSVEWGSSTRIYDDSNGNLRISNNAQTDFGLLRFGGTTSSFPALKRSGTALSARLADDSGNAPISASLFRTCQTEADGCWQFIPSGSDMLLQYRTGGAWVTKATWAP